MNNTPDNQKSPFRAPSARVTAALAAAMLGDRRGGGRRDRPRADAPRRQTRACRCCCRSLAQVAAARAAQAAAAAAQPPAITAEATPHAKTAQARRKRAQARRSHERRRAPRDAGNRTDRQRPRRRRTSNTKASTLAPVTHVWLIELAGTSFAQARAPAGGRPVHRYAGDPRGDAAERLVGARRRRLRKRGGAAGEQSRRSCSTRSSSPRARKARAGAPCATGKPGALTAADEFLKATVPTITSSAAFRENGLIVVTFASVGLRDRDRPARRRRDRDAHRQPAGRRAADLAVRRGGRASPPPTFNPTSPKQSLEKLLRR